MKKLYRVKHKTLYQYSIPVSLCHNEAHLVPRSFWFQQCKENALEINPRPAVCKQRQDFFGNQVTYFAVQEPHTSLEVTASSEVEVDLPTYNLDNPLSWTDARDKIARERAPDLLEARQFTLDSPFIATRPELFDYVRPSFPDGRPLVQAVRELNERIHKEYAYDPNFTTIATPLADVLHHRRGVCQDFAHLAIGCLRSLGLAARYVSGYLESVPPPGQPRLVGGDASHAWASVYVPDVGWIDFDPTNNHMPTNAHITVAWGRDYSDVTPLKGVILGGGAHTLAVSVDVAPVVVP